MAYDEKLADRIRRALGRRAGLTERKMFGGLAFMLRGNMCCGVVGSELMVRVGPDAHDAALAQPGSRPSDFNGRSVKGMVFVSDRGLGTEPALRLWLERGLTFTGSLPAKGAAPARTGRPRKAGRPQTGPRAQN